MVQLTDEEINDLKFLVGTSSWYGTGKSPRAFTEQGIAMLSSVVNSKRAIQVTLEIMRAFAKLREMIVSN